MSFLSVIKTIGKDALIVEQAVAPVVSMFVPALAGPLNLINKLIVQAETIYTGEKQGTPKKQFVLDEFQAILPTFQEIIKEKTGYIITFDVDALSKAIDASVATFNAAKALHDSFDAKKLT